VKYIPHALLFLIVALPFLPSCNLLGQITSFPESTQPLPIKLQLKYFELDKVHSRAVKLHNQTLTNLWNEYLPYLDDELVTEFLAKQKLFAAVWLGYTTKLGDWHRTKWLDQQVLSAGAEGGFISLETITNGRAARVLADNLLYRAVQLEVAIQATKSVELMEGWDKFVGLVRGLSRATHGLVG